MSSWSRVRSWWSRLNSEVRLIRKLSLPSSTQCWNCMLTLWLGLSLTFLFTALALLSTRRFALPLSTLVSLPQLPLSPSSPLTLSAQGDDRAYTLSAQDHLARRGSF